MLATPTVRRFAILALGLAICIGCTRAEESQCISYPYATGSRQLGSRELRYNLTGGGHVSMNDDSREADITFERGRVKVETSRVLLDDQEVVTLPEDARIVRVHYNDGRLCIAADGSRIYSKRLDENLE